jgi:hypothetical protein
LIAATTRDGRLLLFSETIGGEWEDGKGENEEENEEVGKTEEVTETGRGGRGSRSGGGGSGVRLNDTRDPSSLLIGPFLTDTMARAAEHTRQGGDDDEGGGGGGSGAGEGVDHELRLPSWELDSLFSLLRG